MISFVQVANLRMNLPAATNVKARAPDSEEDGTISSFLFPQGHPTYFNRK